MKWDTIPTAPFKREGSVQPYVAKLSQLSEQRVAVDPQFKYLNKRTAIAKVTSDQKQVVLDIDKRRAELLSLEKQTLDAENERRIATGQKPFLTGKAIRLLDALAESRAKMKANQRPALPEEETFVNEAANVLMDYAKLQNR